MADRFSTKLEAILALAIAVWLIGQIVPVLQQFADILLLFFLAWLVAFVIDPLVSFLERRRLPRAAAAGSVYAVLLVSLGLLAFVLSPVVVDQLSRLREGVPQFVRAQLPSEEAVADILVTLGLPTDALEVIYQPDKLAQQLQSSAGRLLQNALAVATSALTLIVNVMLMLLLSFYMVLDGRKIVRSVLRMLPHTQRGQAVLFLSQLSANFGGFLRGQVIQALLFGVVVAVLMLALRLDFVAVAAVTSGALMLIPIIGPILAMIPPAVAALTASATTLVVALVVLVPLQVILVNVFMPRILSEQMGMHPLLVFLAILVGLHLGGPLGAFFGIPIMGVFNGMANVLYHRWREASLERRKRAAHPEPAPGAGDADGQSA